MLDKGFSVLESRRGQKEIGQPTAVAEFKPPVLQIRSARWPTLRNDLQLQTVG